MRNLISRGIYVVSIEMAKAVVLIERRPMKDTG
jgi:hypothetical protein